MRGRGDAERLQRQMDDVEQGSGGPKAVRSRTIVEGRPALEQRYGALCRELRVVRDDERDPRWRWQDWMLFCIDPLIRVPIEIDYAERYPAEGGAPSSWFAEGAAALFDSLQFAREKR